MSMTPTLTEWDRIAAELRYMTRAYDWVPEPACLGAIVDWHLRSIATAKTEAWIPGLAESQDPAVEKALHRFHQHQFSRIIHGLRHDNTRLTLQLLTARACAEFYADGSTDAGAQAAKAFQVLTCDIPPSEQDGEIRAA
jgi:hypothetical protein